MILREKEGSFLSIRPFRGAGKPAYLSDFIALLLFGSNGTVASAIALSSYEIVLLRCLIGCVFLWGVFLLTRQRLTLGRHKVHALFLAASGAAMGLGWVFLYEAYRQIGVSMASLAYYCGPVIIMAVSPLFFHEPLTRSKITGFLVVLAGVCLVNGQAAQEGKMGWGLFCGFLSALMFAVLVIFSKKATAITGLENPMLQLTASLITVAVFVVCKEGFALEIAREDWPPILFLGLVNTGIGCFLYFTSISRLPAQTVAICGYLEPLSAVVFSALFLHEVLSPAQVLGAFLILGGAAAGELFSHKPAVVPRRS